MGRKSNTSPDGKHIVSFRYIGDIRFGPAFFRMKLDNKFIKDVFVARNFVWHAESRYIAVQKWEDLDPRKGPHTSLLILDVVNNLMTETEPTYKGLVSPLRFSKNQLCFSKEYLAPGLPPIYEGFKDMDELTGWKKIRFHEPSLPLENERHDTDMKGEGIAMQL